MGEVFQEVKFWRWLMDIRKLKVLVFRQFFLLFLCRQRELVTKTIKPWQDSQCEGI